MIRFIPVIIYTMLGVVIACSDANKMIDLNEYVHSVAFYKNEKMDYKIGFLTDGRFFYQIIQKGNVHDIKTDYQGLFRIKKDTVFLMYRGMPPPRDFTSYLIISPDTYLIQPFTNSNKLLFLRIEKNEATNALKIFK